MVRFYWYELAEADPSRLQFDVCDGLACESYVLFIGGGGVKFNCRVVSSVFFMMLLVLMLMLL